MNTRSATLRMNLRETLAPGAFLSHCFKDALVKLALWHQQSRERRQTARCATLLGHRFTGDTLISGGEVFHRNR